MLTRVRFASSLFSNNCSKINVPAWMLLQHYSTDASTTTTEKHSFVKGSTDIAPIQHTIGYQLSQNARTMPFANAFRSSHQKLAWSYNTLKKHADAFACGLLDVGIKPGDTVGIIQGNNVEQVVAQLACAKIGAILVEFQSVKTSKDLARYLELFRTKLVILPLKLEKVGYLKMLYELFPEIEKRERYENNFLELNNKSFPFLKLFLVTGEKFEKPSTGLGLFREHMVFGPFGYYDNPLRRVALQVSANMPSLILLNDKDVSKAKAYVYSQQNLLNAGSILGKEFGIQQGDRVMVSASQNELFGSIIGNYAAIVNGATLVYPSESWNAAETLRLLSQEQTTVLFAKASEITELLEQKDFDKYKFEHLKTVIVDGSASQDLVERAKDKFKINRVVRLQTLDEVSGLLLIDGKPIANTEYKIVRKQDGKVVHQDTFGELKVRGPLVARGYWNDVGLMNPAIDEDGWLNTGKLCKLDAKGNLIFE